MKATIIEERQWTGHNRMILCPNGCGNLMKDSSNLCIECEAKERGRRLSRQWTEQHLPEMLERHHLVKGFVVGGLSPLEAIAEVQRVLD